LLEIYLTETGFEHVDWIQVAKISSIGEHIWRQWWSFGFHESRQFSDQL